MQMPENDYAKSKVAHFLRIGWPHSSEYAKEGTAMKNTIAIALVCALSLPALAQSNRGMHLENGKWIAPSAELALAAIEAGTGKKDYAVAVLRQKFSKKSSAEIDTFGDKLG